MDGVVSLRREAKKTDVGGGFPGSGNSNDYYRYRSGSIVVGKLQYAPVKTTDYSATILDDIIPYGNIAAARTLTLPDATITGMLGHRIIASTTVATNYALSVVGYSGQSVGGSSAGVKLYGLQTQEFICDGSGWIAVNRKRETVLNVLDFGADPTGVSPSTTAFTMAFEAARNIGGNVRIYVPRGTYLISAQAAFGASGLTIFGDGAGASVIKAGAALNGLFLPSSIRTINNITFEDIGFDLQQINGAGINIDGSGCKSVFFNRVGFWGFGSGTTGIILSRPNKAILVECWADGDGSGEGSALSVSGGGGRVECYRCESRYMYAGWAAAGTGTETNVGVQAFKQLIFRDCFSDGGWYTLPAIWANEGAGVTYTGGSGTETNGASILTDPAANFTGLGLSSAAGTLSNIRVMPTLESGTIASSTGLSVVDSAATFVTNGVRDGHIVRVFDGATEVAFGIVSGVESETKLWVEEWLDPITRRVMSINAQTVWNGKTYKVYDVYIASTFSSGSGGASISATQIVLDATVRFVNFRGQQMTPPAGTRYEILPDRPNYTGIHTDYSVEGVSIIGCTVLRSWADGLSVYGNAALIAFNYVAWGEDTGITVNGGTDIAGSPVGVHRRGRTIVTGNRVYQCGGGSIFLGYTKNALITENEMWGYTPWVNIVNTPSSTPYIGHIYSYNTKGGIVANNVIDLMDGSTNAKYGMGFYQATDVTLIDNRISGASVADMVFTGVQTNVDIRKQKGTIELKSGASWSQFIYEELTAQFRYDASVDASGWFYLADKSVQVIEVEHLHRVAGTDGGAVTMAIRKVTANAVAPDASAGATVKEILSSALNLKATANTRTAGSITATVADTKLADGDRLAYAITGTRTSLAGGFCVVRMRSL